MKKIRLLLFIMPFITVSCGDQDFPYQGYLHIPTELFINADGGAESISLETDHKDVSFSFEESAAGWCSSQVNGANVTLNFGKNDGAPRYTTIKVMAGYIEKEITIYQWGTSGGELEYFYSDWTATCSDEQISDGGGVKSIFSKDQKATYWHSAWNPAAPLPHWIIVDLKREAPLSRIRLGWRDNSYHTDTRAYTISLSTDGENYTEVADVDRGSSPSKVEGEPPYTDSSFSVTKARYVKIFITQSNRGANCNMGAFIPFVSEMN